MNGYEQILKQIKVHRQLEGMSQKEMADKLNISQSAYGKIETGNTFISIDRLNEICKILSLNMFDLLRLIYDTDKTAYKLIVERNQAEKNLEINEKWFGVVDSMIHALGEKIRECELPEGQSKKPLVVRIEELRIKYEDLINAVDVYKLSRLPEDK